MPKQDTAGRDVVRSPAVVNASAASRLDSSRVTSTSHPDLVQLQHPAAVTPYRYGESAVSRLAPRTAARQGRQVDPRLLGSDAVNNQRVIEWQMRNLGTKVAERQSQPPQFDNSGSEQRPNYYPARPQSQLIEPGYVMSGPGKTASSLAQSTSVPNISDNVVSSRGQLSASFHQPSSSADMTSGSTPALMYPGDQRYSPRQLPPSTYSSQFAPPVQPVPGVKAPTSEMARYPVPLPGMVPQVVRHLAPNVHSNLPGVRQQQPPITGDSTQYLPQVAATVAMSSEQRPSYYSTRPQSQLTEPGYPGYVVSKPASPLPQTTTVPAVTESVVGNRSQTSSDVRQQPSAGYRPSFGTPVYSDDERYRPRQVPPSAQFNQRPEMSDMIRHPVPAMAPQYVPGTHHQAAMLGTSMQYQPIGEQDVRSGMITTPYGDVGGKVRPVSGPVDTSEVRYGMPDMSDRSKVVRLEEPSIENRAIPAGVPYSADGRPYSAHEGPYGPARVQAPEPTDIQYGMQNVTPTARLLVDTERKGSQVDGRFGMPTVGSEVAQSVPVVRYDTSKSQDSLEASRDQSAVKFGHQDGQIDSSFNTTVSYSSQEAPYDTRITSTVPAGMSYEPSNSGDSWPLPPPQDRYRAPNVRDGFPAPPSVSVPSPSSQLPMPHLQNVADGSGPFPVDMRPRVQSAIVPEPKPPPGVPSNGVRPKKQPPPVPVKPKFPVITGATPRTSEMTKNDGRQLRPEKFQQKMMEIQRLESRPYLTANEQTRLQNLRVEVEFERRLTNTSERRGDDSDLEHGRMLPPTVRFLILFCKN